MKKINKILIAITIIISMGYAINDISNQNLYGLLIRLSIIPVILLPYIAEKLFKIKISNASKLVYIIFIILSHFLGSVINLYHQINGYDTFTHTLFGFVASFFALEFLIRTDSFNPKKMWFTIIFIISVISLLAGLWETFEFTCDNLFGKDAQNVLTTGVTDTMKDMIVAYLGCAFFCLMYAYEYLYDKVMIIRKFINNI